MEPERWQKIRTVFESALDVSKAQRATFLDSACRGDTQLRVEVEELLQHLEEAGAFLADEDSTQIAFQTGQLVSGRYRIKSHLGSGGMGEVYEAEDEELHESVALKTIRPDLTLPPGTVDRLRREVRFARRIAHPHICRLFDIGYDAQGDLRRAYVTMELVRGATLTEYLRQRGVLQEPEALELAEQLCGALDAAHRQGIVHGDLKSRNILFVEAARRIVIVDFGLSRCVGGGDTVEGTLSRQVAGTPAYMAPERFEGSPVSTATDIYALGVVLHELIAGDLPPARRNASGERELAPNLPAAWAAAITRCLALSPSTRPVSAGEVAQALRQGDATAPERRRWKRFAGIAAMMTIALVPGTGDRTVRVVETVPPGVGKPYTFQPRAGDLFQSAATYMMRQTPASIDVAIGLYQRGLEKDPQSGPALAQLAQAQVRKFELTRSPVWLEEARRSCEQAERLNPDSVDVLLARALVQRNSGELEAAIAGLRRATELNGRNGELWRQLARAYNQAGNILAAQEAYQQGLQRDPSHWSLYSDLGWFYYTHGQFERAEEEFLAAAGLAPDQPTIFANLGGIYLGRGKLEDAERTLERALALEASPRVASNLGTVYFQRGRFSDAARLYREATGMTPNDYHLWANLGDALAEGGKLLESNSAYDRAIDRAQTMLKTSGENAEVLICIALYSAKRKLFPQSRDSRERATALAPRDSNVLFWAAVTEELGGERSAALASLRSALQVGLPMQTIEGTYELKKLRADPAFLALASAWAVKSTSRR